MIFGTQRAAAEEHDPFTQDVRPFLKRYCTKCHGAEVRKGDRRFDSLSGKITSDGDMVDLQDILDQLNLGEMPPPDQLQPNNAERREVVAWLTSQISVWNETQGSHGRHTVLRRLNAREYRNTVRDLLKIEMTMFDPTQSFPRDQQTKHLDNIGEELVTSGYLLQQYLAAAERVVEKALTPARRPTVQEWTFTKNFQQQPEIDQVHRRTNNFDFMTLYEVRGADKHEGAYGAIRDFIKGVPEDGFYEIEFEAEALNREHQYDRHFLGTDPSEPLRLGIVPGDHTVGELHHTQPVEPLLTEVDIQDGRKSYSVRIWLDAGMTPRFTFENGSMDVRTLWNSVFRKYPDLLPKPKKRGIVEARYLAIKHGNFPQIRIHQFRIRGPIYDEWPTPAHRTLLGDDWQSVVETDRLPEIILRQRLSDFMTRAYRRPVMPDELNRIEALVSSRQKSGRSAIDAYGDGLKAVLCSPSFLYLEANTNDAQTLNSYSIASRLARFLWSSMPDKTLLDAAAQGELSTADELRAQTSRMLADARSDAFVDGFPDSWLTLRDLGATPPDRSTFPDFYHYDLNASMREETRLFIRHMLDNDLNVRNFLDSDFAFVNKALARHYQLPVPTDRGFRKISLTDGRRGGLLGQASVLTVTANGIDTSPVVRGVWILENILGTPPSPPPPDVEPLDPDIRGAKTIRDQLQKHRSVPACNDCHRKIDPLGFALENFDPVGRWRTTYGARGKIDSSGKLPDGNSFTNISEFKRLLLQREDQFVRALTEKLLEYATGRVLVPADRVHVDQIVTTLKSRGNGFKSLISLVVQSPVFASR